MGLEPTTSAVTGRRSNQLSHRANTRYYTLKTEPDDLSTMNFLSNSFEFSFPILILPDLLPWLSPRPISTGQLNALLHLHLPPIYLVVFKGSYE